MSLGSKFTSARLPLIVGFASAFLMLGGLGTWSFGTEIAGAVVAPGVIRVESEQQVIQHPDGGVVSEILAHDGDRVAAGDVLVRLDGTFIDAELSVVERQLLEIQARKARFVAERNNAAAPDFRDVEVSERLDPDWVKGQLAGQKTLFAVRLASMQKELEQIDEQKHQIGNQIEGSEAQLAALDRQHALIEEELADQLALQDKKLVTASRVLALQREQARMSGEIGQLTSVIAEAHARIASLSIEAIKLDNQRREEAITRLRDLTYTEIELQERRLSLLERLARLDVRSPVSGTVFGSKIFARQSVVRPADPMMYVVPGGERLIVAARVSPVHIDEVRPGQEAILRFTSFDSRTTPEVHGTLMRVSADALQDEATGAHYYEAVIRPEVAGMEGLEVIPGMPVEVFLRTGDRTPMSYLTRPLAIYFSRAMREN